MGGTTQYVKNKLRISSYKCLTAILITKINLQFLILAIPYLHLSLIIDGMHFQSHMFVSLCQLNVQQRLKGDLRF